MNHTDNPRELLRNLFVELFQTERSASLHSRREAHRLGDTPPAEALREISRHATAELPALRALAQDHGFPATEAGRSIGKLFSNLRNAIADRALSAERSYRFTLLGLRHGIDLVRMVRALARQNGDWPLIGFCDAWLEARVPLVEEACARLSWFAERPARALETATHRKPIGLLQKVITVS